MFAFCDVLNVHETQQNSEIQKHLTCKGFEFLTSNKTKKHKTKKIIPKQKRVLSLKLKKVIYTFQFRLCRKFNNSESCKP